MADAEYQYPNQPEIEVDQGENTRTMATRILYHFLGPLPEADALCSIKSERYSITSSLNEYLEQHGRRYHVYFGPDKNPMPNDKLEQERLDTTHERTRLLSRGQTQLAPIHDGSKQIYRVLDLGTGTGVWAVDFASENPQCEVVGIDLSPIQPGWVPPNCRFEIDDFELEWNYKTPFNFINARTITQSVNGWPKLLGQAKKHLNPGGWIEVSEYSFELKCDDGTIPPDWPPAVASNLLREALQKIGRLAPEGQTLKSLVEQAGFEDVQLRKLKAPSGTWPRNPVLKQAGGFLVSIVETGYESYMLSLLTQVLEMPAGKELDLCKEARLCHQDNKVHAYWEFYSVFGWKSANT